MPGRKGSRRASRPAAALLLSLAGLVAWRCAVAFVGGLPAASRLGRVARRAQPAVRVVNPPREGEREVVDGPHGPIIVAKLGGEFFAVDGTCPHLNLPMKRGKIEKGQDGPILTCSFHNSCFNMKNGKCTKWVTGVLGFENDIVGGLMGNVGGQKTDIRAYKITDHGDGYLWLEEKIGGSS
mmetsp:Transcript_74730/g.206921  ORF Transcript_74730/g.206921 Transcript_74730/m.206921 type:complete len:181 (+) Transcript_74730:58-600(+)